jgi:predicted helicase
MTRQNAKDVLKRFISLPTEIARQELKLGNDSMDWKISKAQDDLKETNLAEKYLIEISYRPFDNRYTYYTGVSGGFHSRPRPEVMRNMMKINLALLTSRMTKGESFAHVSVTQYPSEKILLSAKTSNNSFHFPLYLYPKEETSGLFAENKFDDANDIRRPNLASSFIDDFASRLELVFVPDGRGDRVKTFGPEDVFHYMYAVFHSPTYRSRYAEFLKIDFPRLPLTSDPGLFRSLCELGRGLVALHLLEEHPAQETRFPIAGDGAVEAVRYAEPGQGSDAGRVWINKTQYFEGVPPEIWAFHVGGYQVCQKWLKDRKGRRLSYDDITHYQRIVAALGETIRLMAEIDRVIEAHGGWPLK